MEIHPGVVPAPAIEDASSHGLRPSYNQEEEENLLDKHVGEVVWPNFVSDRIAVSIAHTVADLALRTLL